MNKRKRKGFGSGNDGFSRLKDVLCGASSSAFRFTSEIIILSRYVTSIANRAQQMAFLLSWPVINLGARGASWRYWEGGLRAAASLAVSQPSKVTKYPFEWSCASRTDLNVAPLVVSDAVCSDFNNWFGVCLSKWGRKKKIKFWFASISNQRWRSVEKKCSWSAVEEEFLGQFFSALPHTVSFSSSFYLFVHRLIVFLSAADFWCVVEAADTLCIMCVRDEGQNLAAETWPRDGTWSGHCYVALVRKASAAVIHNCESIEDGQTEWIFAKVQQLFNRVFVLVLCPK